MGLPLGRWLAGVVALVWATAAQAAAPFEDSMAQRTLACTAWLTGTPQDGRLAGDLILAGGGDATLDSKRLTDWFKRVHKQGP